MAVNLPLTGAGGTTATIATEQIGGAEYQYVKLVSGVGASTAAGSTSAVLGSVSVSSGVVLGAGSSANTLGSVVNAAGSSDVMMGGVALSSGNPIYLGLGTTGTYQFVQSIAFSSGNIARSSVSTTIDIQIIAANANRKALIIANRSTAQTVGCGFSTAAVTTALANVDFFIGPSSFVSFGIQGGFPLARGPIRGINLTSTTVAGSVGVIEFT
jgi:hypothetical protein